MSENCTHYEPRVPHDVGMTYGSELAGDATDCKNCGRTAVEHIQQSPVPSAEAEARAWCDAYGDGLGGYQWTDARVAEFSAHVRQQEREKFSDIERISDAVHDAWMQEHLEKGVTSVKSRSDGEEFMVPYEQLSEHAKEMDRITVRTVIAAAIREG